MSYVEVLTDNGLTQEQWDNDIFMEYLGQTFMKRLMGKTERSVIQVDHRLEKAAGDAVTFGLAGQVEGGKVTGNNRGLGNEGSMEFYNQRVTVDNVRHLVKIQDVKMANQRVGFDILQKAKTGLKTKSSRDLDSSIIAALTDTSSGRVRGRYLYGAADSNWNATHATALQNIDNTADKLTVAMVNIAKRKAQVPVNATAKISPAILNLGSGMRDGVEEWFVVLVHPWAARDLTESDPSWKNAELNLPPSSKRTSPIFTGSSFLGARNGVLYHVVEDLPLISSTIQCSHNLLLGAQSGFVAWGQTSKFGEEPDDFGHEVSYENHEIRGIAKAVFNRTTEEDHGIVNVFSAAVAD